MSARSVINWGSRRMLLGAVAILVLGAGVAAAARHARSGSLDTRFAKHGIATLGSGTRLFGDAVQSDGKVVAVGESGYPTHARLLLARFTASGRLDRSFGHRGIVNGPAVSGAPGSVGRAVAIQRDGKIVVVGSATDKTGAFAKGLLVERYNRGGSLDRRFGSRGVADLLSSSSGDGYAVAVERSGKIVATGSADAAGSQGTWPRVAVAMLSSKGRPYSHFGSHGIAVIDLGPNSYAYAVGLAKHGKIVIAGSTAPGLQIPQALLAGLTGSGALDRSFASGGSYVHQYASGASFSSFNALDVQGGSIIAAGSALLGQAGGNAIVARFTASGHQVGVSTATSATNYTAIGSGAPGSGAPGAYGVTVVRGKIVAVGELANGPLGSLAVWEFNRGGGPIRGFGSGGVAVLKLGNGDSSEAAGVAPASGGKFVVVGDQNPPLKEPHAGLVLRYQG